MIKTPLSTVIGGAFWTPGAVQIGSSSKDLTQIIKSLFSLGEQGFAYDPNDLTTLYQDAAGTIPVTAAGQPVGLMLDKSKSLNRGIELLPTKDLEGFTASTPSGLTITNSTITTAIYYGRGAIKEVLTVGKWYELELRGTSDASVSTNNADSLTAPSVRIEHMQGFGVCRFLANYPYLYIRNGATGTTNVSLISLKELAGNHAYQTVSAMRPLLVAAPQRLDYDAVDDKLITNLPTQLTDCTVIRSVPNVGTQILMNQTIPATYEDNKDHCGLIVINRALTPRETSAITAELNKRAGV